MFKFLCRLFNKHDWKYYIISDTPQKNIRICKRCMKAQEWKWWMDHFVWMWLVGRTKQGADKWLKDNDTQKIEKE